MRPFLLALAVGFAVSGCGGEGGGYGTAGGAGAATGGAGGASSTTGSGGGGGGLAGAGGGTGGSAGGTGGAGGALVCDAIGACGNTGEGCVKCAVEGACAEEYAACFESAACGKYSTCLMQCAGDAGCIGGCDAQLPDGKVLFDAYQGCVLCGECVRSCASAASCPPGP